MSRDQIKFGFLNIGHFLDHFFMLIFATAAALRLTTEWQLSYAQLIPYATPGFIAFGLCAIPAGWLADKWSREGMMSIFFVGIGLSAICAGMANTPMQIGAALVLVGIFAAIYHPVGLAMVVQGRKKTGIPLAINGIFGNMGVASAALLTAWMIDTSGWRSAFVVSGIVSIVFGALYLLFNRGDAKQPAPAATASASTPAPAAKAGAPVPAPTISREFLIAVFAVIFFTTALGGLIFQSTTFALPKVLAEEFEDIAGSATMIGWYAFVVFAVAAFAQLVVGYMVDNYSIRMVFAVITGLQALFFIVMSQVSGMLALLTSVAFMLVVFGQIPINDVLVGRITKSEWRSRAFAARYIITFSVAATAVPLIAWVHGRWGFDTLFLILAAVAFLIFLAVFKLPATEKLVAQ